MPRYLAPAWIVKILHEHGFRFVSQSGSHAKFRLENTPDIKTVIMPMHAKELPVGTFASIVRQSGLDKSDFIKT